MQKLEAIRQDLRKQVLDQQEAIDLLLTAIVMGDHVALVGPAGEGKTFLAQRAATYLPGDLYYHLLTRFTVPDEVLGHPSLAKLQKDIFERRTTGKAPEAELVVLDEVFKANSPMLNSLLGMMNERVVDGIACQLRTLIGLSNEWPRAISSADRHGDDESLLPLWDRFIFRLEIVQPQSDQTFRAILRNNLPAPSADKLTEQDLADLTAEATKLHNGMSEGIVSALLDIRARLTVEGVTVSSRRWYKASKALAAYAVVCGDSSVMHKHLRVLAHVLWQQPEQRDVIADAVMESGAPETSVALTMEAEAIGLLNEFRAMPARAIDRPVKLSGLIKHCNGAVHELKALDAAPDTSDHSEVRRVISELTRISRELLVEMQRELSL